MTGRPGKSRARVVHSRMDELPTKTMPPGAGGWAASPAVSWLISSFQRSGAAEAVRLSKARTNQQAGRRRDFTAEAKTGKHAGATRERGLAAAPDGPFPAVCKTFSACW